MDWERAKTVLIIAFIGLNIFLAYRLWGQPVIVDQPEGIISPEQVQQAISELGQRGIDVHTTLPSRTPALADIDAAISQHHAERLVSRYLTEATDAAIEYTDSGEIVWSSSQIKVTLSADGRTLQFEREPLTPGSAPELDGRGVWDDLRARQVARAFLDNHDIALSEHVGARVEYDRGTRSYIVTYYHDYSGWPVFNVATVVSVGHWGVLSVRHTLVDLGSPVGDRTGLLPATDALIAWSEQRQQSEQVSVTNLELGYYFQHDVAMPVWRIEADLNETWFVNARTGEVKAE